MTNTGPDVLNLAAIAVKYAGDPEHTKEPLCFANNLAAGVIIKHRLRVDELENFDDLVRTATKLIIPFDRANLALGYAYGASLLAYMVDGTPRPFSATFAVTNRCNLRCGYCNCPFIDRRISISVRSTPSSAGCTTSARVGSASPAANR